MGSYDVRNLYPSVPIKKTLEITKKLLQNDKTLKQRTSWSIDHIMIFLEICLETHFKSLNGTIYTQTDGTPIGKSISGPIAGIYLRWFEDTFVKTHKYNMQIILGKRQKDDVFIIWRKCEHFDIEDLRNDLNSVDPRIYFTMELEKKRKLPFLDLDITRLDDRFITKVYRKDTHTNKYINWNSNCSEECLIGTMKTLIFRAHELCDLEQDKQEELQFLKNTFISNDFPPQVVDKVFHTYKPGQKKNQDEDAKPTETICVPYVPGFSERFRKVMRKNGIRVVFNKGRTLGSLLVRTKASTQIEKSKDHIYLKNCSTCKSMYIGETGQYQKKRDQGHKADIKQGKKSNSFFMHLNNNKNHQIDWETTKILDNEKDYHRRIIKESLYINAFRNEKLMNLEDGKPINPIWKQFNADIRKLSNI